MRHLSDASPGARLWPSEDKSCPSRGEYVDSSLSFWFRVGNPPLDNGPSAAALRRSSIWGLSIIWGPANRTRLSGLVGLGGYVSFKSAHRFVDKRNLSDTSSSPSALVASSATCGVPLSAREHGQG